MHGIAHRKVTPYWPQANAQVERFNRTIEKAIRGAYVEGKDWRKELYIFLLNYRATPHATTGVSPALLHLGREIRTKVPQVEIPVSHTLASALKNAKVSDSEAKQKMARYTDVKKKAKPSMVNVGDKVLLQQKRQHKLSTRYDCRPYTVIARRGPSVILQRDDETPIMRNVSLVHKIPNETTSEEEDVDLSEGSTQEAVVVAENNGSEDGVSEIGDGPNDVEVVEARNRPARQVRPPSYLRDFVRSVNNKIL
jgi:hypothetical protein